MMIVALRRCTRGTAVAADHNKQAALEFIDGTRQWADNVRTRKSGHCEVLMCVG
jgi:hypothetical protein